MMAETLQAAGDLADEVQDLRERVSRVEALLEPVLVTAGRLQQIDEAVADFHANRSGTPHDRARRVAGIVAEEWATTTGDLLGSSRFAEHIRPRFVLCWLLRNETKWSTSQVGRYIGGRDHTTIIYACRRVDGWREKDSNFRLVTDQLSAIAGAVLRGEFQVDVA